MKILDYRPSKETAYLIHAVFFNFYFILIGRAVLVFSEIQIRSASSFSWKTRLSTIEKLSEIIFFSVGQYNVFFDEHIHLPTFNVSLLCTFVAYLTIHRGMFMDTTPKPESSWLDKMLKICRAIFFMLGSILLILMLIRMGYALYEQFVPNGFKSFIVVPKY